MRSTCLPSTQRSGLAWLVWLALLLPLAQAAAVWHGYSHPALLVPGAHTHQDDAPAPASTPCDVCLSAAALGSGALFGALPGVPASTAHHEPPRLVAHAVRPATRTPAYLSRAPPAASL